MARNGNLGDPASDAAVVTPNDSADLAGEAQALYVGVGGNINLTTIEGTTVVFVGVSAGVILPVRTKRVLATSTTATNIIALY